MGSAESHFNVSLIVRDKVTRQCPQTTIFEEKGEPKRYRTEVLLLASLYTALPLGQTGSQYLVGDNTALNKFNQLPNFTTFCDLAALQTVRH